MALVAFLVAMTGYLYIETRWLKTSLYALEGDIRTPDNSGVDEEPNKEEEQEETNGSGDA